MRRLISLLSSISLLAACASAPPQPPAIGLAMVWTAPVTNTDGTRITAPLTYGVYTGPCGHESRVSVVTVPSFTLPAGAAGCGYVTAIEHGVESKPSAVVPL